MGWGDLFPGLANRLETNRMNAGQGQRDINRDKAEMLVGARPTGLGMRLDDDKGMILNTTFNNQ